MSGTMRAVGIHGGKGPASALFIAQIAKPIPSSSQALVKIRAFGVNRMDVLQRDGHYTPPSQAPATLGLEFSGTVEGLGPDAGTEFSIGDQVFGLAYGGAYAEYIVVSTAMLIHKPPELSWEEAAGIPETWITALQALFVVGDFQPGQSVLWHAGASTVSICGIQLAKALGAKAIYATVGSQEKIEFLESKLGVTKAFNYRTEDWAAEIQRVTDNAGVDLILDFVGAPYFASDLQVAARDGQIIFLGLMGGQELPQGVNISALVYKRLRVEGSTLRGRNEDYQRHLRDKLVSHALPRFRDGSFKVFIEKIFGFEQIQAAHGLLESNITKGKIICVFE